MNVLRIVGNELGSSPNYVSPINNLCCICDYFILIILIASNFDTLTFIQYFVQSEIAHEYVSLIILIIFQCEQITEGKSIIYLYVLEGTKTVIGCLVAEEVRTCPV